MQLVLLLAGMGTRLRPLTLTRPKCLIRMAGKAILEHLLDRIVTKAPIDELVVVCAPAHRQEIEDCLRTSYRLPMVCVQQPNPRGQAHAVYLARRHLRAPFLLAFGDTIVEADLEVTGRTQDDALIFVEETATPQCHGAVTLQGDRIVGIEEKPQNSASRHVAAGLYFVREETLFLRCVEEVVRMRRQEPGETFLAETFQRMIDKGGSVGAQVADRWEDCGEPEGLLAAHRYVLEASGALLPTEPAADLVVRPPVFIADSATVERSEIGPHVSIDAGAVIRRSRLVDCIIGRGTTIEDSDLFASIVGCDTYITGLRQRTRLLLADHCQAVSDRRF